MQPARRSGRHKLTRWSFSSPCCLQPFSCLFRKPGRSKSLSSSRAGL